MGIVKQLLKAPVEAKLYNEYLNALDASYYPYDLYAKTVRSSLLENIGVSEETAKEKTTVIEFDKINDETIKDVLTEYTVFVSDIKGLDDDALRLIVDAFLKDERIMCVYGDEDEINSTGKIRMSPWFKPDWSPDTLLDHMYTGNVIAFRSEKLKGLKRFENIYDICLSVMLGCKKSEICHIQP